MRYGYCRTSKPKQSIERQIRNIKVAYPDAVIVQEVFTRTRLDRPEWLKLMRRIQPGDEIVFDSVSRMSGDAKEGFAAYEELYQKGVNLVYLKEPHINTETYKKALENNIQLTGSNVDYILEGINRYLLELAKEQIRLAFEQSEKEVQDLHQRTREGIETARLNGKQIGRQKNSIIRCCVGLYRRRKTCVKRVRETIRENFMADTHGPHSPGTPAGGHFSDRL